ncbi:MAG: ATP-grasp domain-containing protein [Lachnospiraceae bacterium]|nr:ATP-grasp domain-containing protein [Lachnospiraceae bacterium]
MERVLITGGSHSEVPLIKALHRLGYEVISTGKDDGGLGHQLADHYEKGDYSDWEYVLGLAQKWDVCGIVSGCNDFAYLSTAYACAMLGLPGHDAPVIAGKLHHKNEFRKQCRQLGIQTPAFYTIESTVQLRELEHELQYPVIVKPTDLTGGKGVRKCDNFYEVEMAYQAAVVMTRAKEILIEEYVEGSNHGVSALLKNGKVCFAFFDNEEYYKNKYLVVGAYAPSDLTEEMKDGICRDIEKLAGSWKLKDGLFHCQCILKDHKNVYFIDPCRRSPGDLYLLLVEYATGCRYAENIVRAELGLEYDIQVAEESRRIARECLMPDRNGVYQDLFIPKEYEERIVDKVLWGQKGFMIDDYLKYKVGILFLEFDSVEEEKRMLRELRDKIRLRME